VGENSFEVHDPAAHAQARAILNSSESPRDWARAVVEAVTRNDEWRGKRCINLLAPEAPTSPTPGASPARGGKARLSRML
jgi:glycine hydroxymethyltransferase